MTSRNSGHRSGRGGARHVLVWREAWLPLSETFVRHHVDQLTRWRATAAGIWTVDSPMSRATDRTMLATAPPRSSRLHNAAAAVLTAVHLVRVTRRERPTLIHVHFLTDAVPVVRAARLTGIPVVVTVHGYDVSRWPLSSNRSGRVADGVRRYRMWAAGRTLRSAQLVIAVSQPIREKALALGAPPDRTMVNYLGIPVPPDPGPRRGDSDQVAALFVGRLTPKKGVADLLEAWARLPEHLLDRADLTVVGDGEERSRLQDLAADLGISVTFTGPLPATDVAQLMRESAVLCMPSRTALDGDIEGLPIVLLEALAQRLAVVAYRHSGIPEAVSHGVDGLLAEEGDVEGLAAILAVALDDAHLRDRLGAAGRRRIESAFDMRLCSQRLEHLYDGCARPTSERPSRSAWLSRSRWKTRNTAT